MSLLGAEGRATPPETGAGTPSAEDLRSAPRSAVEESLVQEALRARNLEEDPHPEGKTIEAIEVYVVEVFDDRDPIPNFVNYLHTRTRDRIVAQEVLLEVGTPWDLGRVLETERNLRAIRQHSLANVVAARGSSIDKIRLLVVVKDVWSLRLNSDWFYGEDGLAYLLLQPTEENLAGLRASLGLTFRLERDRYYVGGSFGYPRIGGTRYALAVSAGSYQERWTGDQEGFAWGLVFQYPQFSRYSRWAYGVDTKMRATVDREYQSGRLAEQEVTTQDGVTELVPRIYEADTINASYWGVRSFGVDHKRDIHFGFDIDYRRYRAIGRDGNSEAALAEFTRSYLPVSDRRMNPYASLLLYETRFLRTFDIETLGIQEDIRLGYGVGLTLFGGAEPLGSTRSFVGASAALGYTLPLGRGLFTAFVSNRVVVASQGRHEGFLALVSRLASPTLGVGRLHVSGYAGIRYEDYLNVAPFYLGGNNRLRGYPSGAFPGKNLALLNFEYRTRGIDILSAQVGLAAFYDLGGASNELSSLSPRQGAGVGIRILFPQAERTVMRLDWGFPLSGDRDVLPGSVAFTFGQAFPLPTPTSGTSPFL